MRLSRHSLVRPMELADAVLEAAPGAGQRLSRLYNRRLGPITALRLHRPAPNDFSMYTASCEHSLMSALISDATVRAPALDSMLIPGGGKGKGLGQPVLSALGEGTERLLAVLHFTACVDGLPFATHDMLEKADARALGPDDLPLFAPEQHRRPGFRFQPFRRDTPLRWHPAFDLLSGRPVWVPAQLALLYYKLRPGEATIGYPTSGGLGFAHTRRAAILHGLYEFMERDAINLRWFCRLAPPRVELDLEEVAARLWPDWDWRLSTDGFRAVDVQLATIDHPIPILTMTARHAFASERAFLGAGGAGGSRDRALAQALFELAQTRSVLNAYRPKRWKVIGADSKPVEMTDFLDGTVYFGFRANLPRLDWYACGETRIDWDEVPDLGCRGEDAEYEAMLAWLRSAGLNPVVIDLGGACPPGCHLVRVIVPEMTLASVPANPYLGHRRYYQLPRRLGLADRDLVFAELNPDPIPFP